MEWSIAYAADRKRVAVLVSREDHCLLDLLWRWRSGELDADVGLVISNHRDVEEDVARFGVPFVHVPVTRETKPQAEAAMLERLAGRFDLVVLARYMQILSRRLPRAVGAPMINIHHSFLPAFAGADPYRRASERGVKIIGATAHYVTEELDAGPIIEQDVERVSHRDDVDALVRHRARHRARRARPRRACAPRGPRARAREQDRRLLSRLTRALRGGHRPCASVVRQRRWDGQ